MRACPQSCSLSRRDKISDLRRHALLDNVVVHGSQLLSDPGLDLSAQAGFGLLSGAWLACPSGHGSAWSVSGLSGSGATASKLVLRFFISSFFPRSPICRPTTYSFSTPSQRQRTRLAHCSAYAGTFLGTFFARGTFSPSTVRVPKKGRDCSVDIASRTPTSAVFAPVCPGFDRESGLRVTPMWRRPWNRSSPARASWRKALIRGSALYRLFTKIWNSRTR